MKYIKKLFVSLLLLIIIITSSSCGVTPTRDPSEFDDFSKQVLTLVIGSDEFALNYYFKEPENYGLSHGEPYLPVPTTSSNVIGTILINTILGQVNSFDLNQLTHDQRMTAYIIKDLLADINNKLTDEEYLGSNYLGSYLGYQAQLPILLLQYNFRNENDIINYFKLIDLVPETFKAYVDFEIEKADNGYGMPDFVIENVLGQCEGFLTNIDNKEEVHFMISEVNKKIDEVDFLTSDLKAYYKSLNIVKVRGPLKEGYEYVLNNLSVVKGRATNNMGLAHYVGENGEEIGKNYYTKLFQDAVGYDISVEEAYDYVEEILDSSYVLLEEYAEKIANDPDLIADYKSIVYMPEDIEGQIEYFQSNFTNVPQISSDLNITIKYIDDSISDYFSPAAYIVSAIDEYENEFILLNPKQIVIDNGDGTTRLDTDYLYTTLAHEGYPGHLYQNVYFKSTNPNVLRLLLRHTGYSEGWAKYAETLSLELFFEQNQYDDAIENYIYYDSIFNAAFYTKLDMGIHYYGWTLEETASYIQLYYDASLEDCQSIYEQLTEVPTNYPTYFFTYLKIIDMREEALSKGYSLYDFHKAYLDCGPMALKYVEEYIDSVLK